MATYDVNALLSATAYGSDGDKIGKVEQVFLDDNTEEVTFVTVNTGLFGTKESFVPADGAQQDGDRLVLPYTKDVVKDAPNVDADQHLSPAEEEEIYRYYKMNYSGTDDRDRTDRDRTAGVAGTAGTAGAAGLADRDDRYAADTDRNAVPATGTAGYPENDGYADTDRDRDRTAGITDVDTDRDRTAGVADVDRDRTAGLTDRDRTDSVDNGVVRHEEQLHVGKERQETGRARLRKYVVTENESVDVPLEREEVRVERTPLSGTEATAGTIGEEDVEVTLHEERPVVAKETVGVEKVGLEKETVRDTERVDAEVRKEQVEVETDAERGTGLTDRNRGTGLTDDDRRDRI
ncbi:hypothetical protein CIK52_00185 [Kocuria rosea]|uniref:PRC and DUF2382 domain-containing protein n=1 Tax=Kocuria rosea TaxID=1275 RepID=UPI000D654D7A|nr:PRC and DUF2382 domain-containing protein [Kocuria rosea]MEB2527128.1 PRC and DUF2382 domain-containing protein [Kocuria rosea]MEB2618515.1 PRC and DUF2382 domain-containing protein [Kocuria rosea]PWF87778.1 hypothetical protein CIK52_00185 [Kocuria rosea]QCY32876.1 DUF2382 domain-containing protein [Kocuria rosea]VEH43304.1 Uncharacterized protein conserved in bacteria [Kocuria rosea]